VRTKDWFIPGTEQTGMAGDNGIQFLIVREVNHVSIETKERLGESSV
jgi:hypothetical protein